MMAPTTLASGDFDDSLDAGFFNLNAQIDIEKCVEHTVVGNGQMFVINFEGFAGGTIINDQYSNIGVTISADNAHPSHPEIAMIFDSANSTEDDPDVGTSNEDFGGPGIGSDGGSGGAGPNMHALGNILIISEDGDQSDPDDENDGGTIAFTSDEPVRVDRVNMLDIDNNGILSPGKTWVYKASEVAQAMNTSTVGASTTLIFTGSSATDGPDGNIRTFSEDGIAVNSSKFSRDSEGVWAAFYLGIYSSGLGVTDSSGGDGMHWVDNVRMKN